MKFKAIFKNLFFVFIYCLPLVFVEAFFLATKRELMNGDEYLYPLFAFMDHIDVPVKNGLQRTNIKKHNAHQFLFEYNKETKVRHSKFETDRYGTIKPSDMEKGIALGKVDSIICGGSTTEASLVWHGQRPPDIFSRITGTVSVNAGRSGKDIHGCVKTIDYLLKELAKNELANPSNIIIATNVNTLSTFGWKRGKKNQILYKNSYSLKTLTRKILPGTYYIAYSLRKSFFNNQKDLSDQPLRLKECCHGTASFNKPGSGIIFDWNSKKLKEEYQPYIRSAVEQLDKILKKHSFKKNKVSIAIEPNSYFLSGVSHLIDSRQLLYSISGLKLTPKQSGELTNAFDKLYKNEFEENGYSTITYPIYNLKKDFFYDAVHVTPKGSEAIADNYAKELGLKLLDNSKNNR